MYSIETLFWHLKKKYVVIPCSAFLWRINAFSLESKFAHPANTIVDFTPRSDTLSNW